MVELAQSLEAAAKADAARARRGAGPSVVKAAPATPPSADAKKQALK